MFRRVLCDVVGQMVNRGQMGMEQAIALVKEMSYYGTKKFYDL
jgi:glucuronate isomerase